MNNDLCLVSDCITTRHPDSPAGLCWNHFQAEAAAMQQRNEDPAKKAGRPKIHTGTCEWRREKCDRLAEVKGFCRSHYYAEQRRLERVEKLKDKKRREDNA